MIKEIAFYIVEILIGLIYTLIWLYVGYFIGVYSEKKKLRDKESEDAE